MVNFFNTDRILLSGVTPLPDPKALFQQLCNIANIIGTEKFIKTAAEELLARINPEDIIPEAYREYRPIVRDGLFFFLSNLSLQRLLEIVADQMAVSDKSSGARRLTGLAKRCPTLHKLCQIIARNKHVDADIRGWLVQLESGNYGIDPETIRPHIETQVRMEKDLFSIRLGTGILSEASVGAVCPFSWKDPETGCDQKGVFKVVKPGVETHLAEELRILGDLAGFFKSNAARYPLNDFNFIDVFQDIRDVLTNEIDLLGEQSQLWDAYQFYSDVDEIQIPELVPFSNHAVTAMSYLDGEKVTDAPMPATERKACAKILFNNLILKPIFSRSPAAIFHGDPHAGNVLAHYQEKTGKVRIALVDWSLAGHLSKFQRIGILKLVQSVIKGDAVQISSAILSLSSGANMLSGKAHNEFSIKINELTSSSEYRGFDLIKKAFWLVDQAARFGIVFHRDMLLFRKSLFTLEGILYALDPDYDVDEMVVKYLAVLLIAEIPKRFGCLLFPGFDTPENFRSLMSNKDLQCLLIYHAMEAIKAGLSLMEELIRQYAPNLTHSKIFPFSAFSQAVGA